MLSVLFPPGFYAAYLVLIEEIRDSVLEQLYGIPPCTVPPIDTVIDVAFEYRWRQHPK